MSRSVATRIGPPLSLIAVLLAWWEGEIRSSVTATPVPAPSQIILSLWREPAFYFDQLSATLIEAMAGLAVAIGFSIFVASLLALWTPVRRTLLPVVIASQTIPLVAVAPLLASLIGVGLPARILVTAWLCWFPAVISVTHGLLDVDPRLEAVFESYGASRRDLFWKLRVPSCAPALVAGVRAAAGFALIGAIVVEYSGAPRGIGAFLISQSIHPTDSTRVFGVVLVSALGGLLLTECAHRLTRRALVRYLS